MTVATSPRPKPEAIPDHPGVYLFRDRNGRVIYVGKAISLRKRTASYFQPMRNLHPRTAAMVEASASLEWMLVQSEVEALQLEYNLIKQHRPRYNVRYRDDKSYPWLAVPLADEIPRPRVERGPQAQGDPVLRALRPRLRDPRDPGSPAAHLPDADLLQGGVRPAPAPRPALHPVRHQQVLGAVRRQGHPRGAPADRRGLRGLHGRAHPPDPAAPGGRDAPGRRAAQLRAGGPAPRPAGQRPQGHGAPADGVLDPGGLRHRRLRRGRPGGGRAGVLRPPGPGGGPARVRGRQGRGPRHRRPGRHLRPAALRRPGRRGPPRGVPARPARRRRRPPGLAGRAARRPGRLPGAPAGREAGPAGDGRGQRPRGLRHPQAQAGQRLRRPGPRPQGAPGGPRPARGPAADRVLRHLQPPGQPGGRLDGGVRGRPGPQERVPPLRGPLGRGPGRRGLPARGPDPPPGPPGHRARPEPEVRGTPRGCPGRSGAPQEVRLPAEPDRGRRRPAPAGRRPGGGAGLGQPRPAGGLAGQADGGGVPAGHARPGGHPPDQRGPVPPPAGPRRGPPVRHHLPPQAARPVDDPQRARRHPRGGGDPPTPAGAPFRVGPQGRPGQPGGAGGGSRRRPPAC